MVTERKVAQVRTRPPGKELELYLGPEAGYKAKNKKEDASKTFPELTHYDLLYLGDLLISPEGKFYLEPLDPEFKRKTEQGLKEIEDYLSMVPDKDTFSFEKYFDDKGPMKAVGKQFNLFAALSPGDRHTFLQNNPEA